MPGAASKLPSDRLRKPAGARQGRRISRVAPLDTRRRRALAFPHTCHLTQNNSPLRRKCTRPRADLSRRLRLPADRSLAPASGVAEHNLAAALGDAGRWREAEPHIRLAFTKGIDAAESWLVLGRCLQSLARPDEAERAFRRPSAGAPTLYDAHGDLAQLRWMRSGDVAAALAEVESAILAAPADPRLGLAKAKVLENTGRLDASNALLAALAAAHPHDAVIATAASQIAARLGDGAASLTLAERAATAAPGEPVVAITLITACLAAGQAERAAALAEAMRSWAPENQCHRAASDGVAPAWRPTLSGAL